ncbi:MAG: FRG domain-containing protein [Chloroflexi bacterium]|nr:FRG domain-containing protein [Chloroflexota bacterium]
MTENDIAVVDWETLVTGFGDLGTGGTTPGYVFRGQSDASWPLEPKLHRSLADGGRLNAPEPAGMLEHENAATMKFKAAAPIQLPPAVLDSMNADIDWWPVMQHYGVPTRLLDWTESAYLGVYFASRASPGIDGALFFFHVPTLARQMKSIFGDDADLPTGARNVKKAFADPEAPHALYAVERKTALPDRMLLQQSVFTVCRNVSGNHEAILEEALSGLNTASRRLFGKFVIQANQKRDFMRRLRSMNISAESLFPGLDGIGLSIDESLRSR